VAAVRRVSTATLLGPVTGAADARAPRRYTNAFLGFGPETKHFAVELTYNYGKESYNIGDGFGHFAIATTDVYKMCDSIKAGGGKARVPRAARSSACSVLTDMS
jgi:lactoylglutathione lyase